MADKVDYVKLGLTCADVCEVLNQGLDRRQTDQLSQSVLEAIQQLTAYVRPMMHTSCDSLTELSIHRTVDRIQRKIIKRRKLNAIFRYFRRKSDVEKIATWKLDLGGILRVFDVRFVISV